MPEFDKILELWENDSFPNEVLANDTDFNVPVDEEILKRFEFLISATEIELNLFRHERRELSQQIEDLRQQHEFVTQRLSKFQGSVITVDSISRDDATQKQLTDDRVTNLLKQIEHLKNENRELRNIQNQSQKTIGSLEIELHTFRNDKLYARKVEELRNKYTAAVNVLESTVQAQQNEMENQSETIKQLQNQKKHFAEKIEKLQQFKKDKLEIELQMKKDKVAIENLKKKLDEDEKIIIELKHKLKDFENVLAERLKSERNALQKVQEALSIAESAVQEKEEAQKHERIVKQECDTLAATVGEVMEEAARKVERDIEEINKRFAKKENRFTLTIEKLHKENERLEKCVKTLEVNCQKLEERHKQTNAQVASLTLELLMAKKSLHDSEQALKSSVDLLRNDKVALRHAEQMETKIEEYRNMNKNQLLKYKKVVEDLTHDFEKQLQQLHTENIKLKNENNNLYIPSSDLSDNND